MHQRSKETVLSLANATAVATGVIHSIIGSEVSRTINGNVATRSVLSDLIGSRIYAKFSKYTSTGVAK